LILVLKVLIAIYRTNFTRAHKENKSIIVNIHC